VIRPPMSRRLQGFGTTIFAEMTRLSAEHRAVNLSQGFPDFAGPDFLKEAATRAILADHNQYARMLGELPLVEAIARSLERRHSLTYDPETQVCVFSGCTEALHCSFQALCDPGDEVVLFEPYYDSYRAGVELAGGVPRFVTLRGPDFRWTTEDLEAAFSERTRLVVVNSPQNPTGRVYTREELSTIASLCQRHDVLCLSDEVYEHMVYEGEHLPIATLPGMKERTLTLNSTGKSFSLTGWKIGYATGPAEVIAALATAHQFVTFAVATPFQHAMAEALDAPASYFDELLESYRKKRAQLVDGLSSAGFSVQAPEGTYFVLAGIESLGYSDDVACCRDLVEKARVAAVPPSVFYDHPHEGRGYVRFAFCKKEETLQLAIDRLGEFFHAGT